MNPDLTAADALVAAIDGSSSSSAAAATRSARPVSAAIGLLGTPRADREVVRRAIHELSDSISPDAAPYRRRRRT